MNKEIDITGNKYNHLTAIKRDGNDLSGCAAWIFQCDCGKYHKARKKAVISGTTKSCGKCIKHNPPIRKTHGMSSSKLYKVWHGMIQRCKENNIVHRSRYYDRGITVCKEWYKFESFYKWSISNGYQENLTIDRIDNNKGYAPSNCRWTTPYVQSRNKRTNIMVEHNGEIHCITDWEKILGYKHDVLGRRYRDGERGDVLFRPSKMRKKEVIS